jgi:hypothetical protein
MLRYIVLRCTALQLHDTTITTTLCYTTVHPAVVDEVTTATIPKSTTPPTFRSIRGLALPSMLSYSILFLKLPPPLCAALVALENKHFFLCTFALLLPLRDVT